jgi:CBS-domain-containing membrane protein
MMNTLQKTLVKDAYQLDNEDPILTNLTADFSHVIQNFALHCELRGVFVVDDDNRFLGVITRTDQLEWAQAKLGAFLLKPLTDMDKTIRLITLIGSTSVGDILRTETKNAAVLADDSLAHALKKMIETDLIILPVIDEAQQIIGSLTLTEILNTALIDS